MTEPPQTEVGAPPPFSLLFRLFGDAEMTEIFSEAASFRRWIQVEVELARAQAQFGIVPAGAAEDIARAAELVLAEQPDIWANAANVGYPVLAIVRQLDAHAEGLGAGRVHLGATTQDIMDTATALQLRAATDLLLARLDALGVALADLVEAHARTVMAGRTHAQQAVPITLGMKFAVVLDQVVRSSERLRAERPSVARISLFGAAGTSAALGDSSARLREALARQLDLENASIPWHVSRDAIFAQASNAVAAAEVAARLAREVIDLSRTEINEVREANGLHRGASSTMPQKANPILSEAIVGFAGSAVAQLPALGRAMEAGHERSAGEWQIEWHTVPQVFSLTSSALLRAAELASGLSVDPAAIAANLTADHGLLMAEAYMIALSSSLGREKAHDEVYAACEETRRDNRPLRDVLLERLEPAHRHLLTRIEPEDYVGEAEAICNDAIRQWRSSREQ